MRVIESNDAEEWKTPSGRRCVVAVQEARHLGEYPAVAADFHPPCAADGDQFTAVLLRRDVQSLEVTESARARSYFSSTE